ncbi:MAG: hypothetical protein ACYTFG_10665, partial [Planctomycetota bacterium]
MVVLKQMNEEVLPPRKHIPELPSSYSNLVEKMMAKDPEERFQDAGEVLKAMEDIERGIDLAYTARRVRRRRFRAVVGMFLFATLAVVAGVGIHAYIKLQRQSEIIARETPQRRAQDLLNEGKAQFDSWEFGKAAPLLRQAMETWPDIEGAEVLLARSLSLHKVLVALDAGDAALADDLLGEYGENHGTGDIGRKIQSRVDLFRNARACVSAERWTDGIEKIDSFIEIYPNNQPARRMKALLSGLKKASNLMSGNDAVGALATLKEILPLARDYPEIGKRFEEILASLDQEVVALIDERRLEASRDLVLKILSVTDRTSVLRRRQEIDEQLGAYRQIVM